MQYLRRLASVFGGARGTVAPGKPKIHATWHECEKELKVTELDRIKRLVNQAIDEFDEPSNSVSKTLRRCTRIAVLRNDYRNLFWLQMEGLNISTQKSESEQNSLRLRVHFEGDEWMRSVGPEMDAYMSRRALANDGFDPRSVAEIEDLLVMVEAQIEGLVVPEGLTPIDLYFRSDDIGQAKTTLIAAAMPLRSALRRIGQRLHDFLLETEHQLEYGQLNADIFERTRRFVDEQLARVAPSALASFNAAYLRASDGDAESLSHALTSCRRVLKSVADAVYPATALKVVGVDGKERSLTDDKYMNRLLQAVTDHLGKSSRNEVLKEVINDLGKRLSALNSLASKGVHDTVTAAEVDTCVIQTYLVVGEVLRVASGQSALQIGGLED